MFFFITIIANFLVFFLWIFFNFPGFPHESRRENEWGSMRIWIYSPGCRKTFFLGLGGYIHALKKVRLTTVLLEGSLFKYKLPYVLLTGQVCLSFLRRLPPAGPDFSCSPHCCWSGQNPLSDENIGDLKIIGVSQVVRIQIHSDPSHFARKDTFNRNCILSFIFFKCNKNNPVI